jgi:hypothetical protein
MSTYKGRNRQQHEEWVKAEADYFTVIMFRGRSRFEAKTLEEAKDAAQKYMVGLERSDTQAAMIYAVKGIHSVMVASYHPLRGFKMVSD